jgi:hypothetical protein
MAEVLAEARPLIDLLWDQELEKGRPTRRSGEPASACGFGTASG